MNKASTRIRPLIACLVLFTGLAYAVIEGSYNWRGRFDLQLFGLVLFGGGLLAWLGWRGWIQRARIPHTGLGWVFALGLVCVTLSLIFSHDPRQGLWRVSWLAGYVLLFYLLIDAFDTGWLGRNAALTGLLGVSGAAVLLALLETYAWYLGWFAAVGGKELPPFPYRFGSIFGYSNVLMSLANLAAPLALAVFAGTRRRLARVAAAGWIVMFLIAIPFSSSRGGWIGIAGWLGCLVLVWLLDIRAWRWIAGLSKRVRLALGAGGLLALAAAGALGLRFWLVFSSNPSHGGDPFGGRTNLWVYAIQLWKQSPLLGIGPGRYALEIPVVDPLIPPGFWSYNAHGMPVEVLAEFGLFGAAVLLALVGLGAWKLIAVYRAIPVQNRLLPRAILAALVGWLCQMVVDDFTSWISIMVPLILLAALLFTAKPGPFPRRSKINLGWLYLPAGLLLVYAIYDLWAYQPAWKALADARQNRWAEAAQGFEVSRQRDPNLTFYTTEAAWAYSAAWAQSGDAQALVKARRLLSSSLEKEGQFSQFWADLAVLDWQAGESSLAVEHMTHAMAHSPTEASYPLNLGYFQEQLSQPDQAVLNYRKALTLLPTWASHPFWQSSPLRQQAVAGFVAADDPALTRYHDAMARLSTGDPNAAERLLAFASLEGEAATAVDVGYARLAEARGDQPAMQDLLRRLRENTGVPALKTQSNLSFGYTLWAYNRPGLVMDLVPGYLRLDGDYGQYQALDQLHTLEVQQGQCAQAAQTWQVYQSSLRGFAPGALPPAPNCP